MSAIARLLGLGPRVAARAAAARRRRAAASADGQPRPDHAAAPSTRGRSSRSIQSTIAWVDVPGVKMAATPSAFSAAASSSGTMPPPNTTTSSAPRAFSAVEHRREVRHVRPRHHRQPDRVDRFLLGRRRDHLGRLVQAAVDDLVAGVGERARHDLGATVVPVEPSLRDQDAELAFHGRKSTSERPLRRDAAARTSTAGGPRLRRERLRRGGRGRELQDDAALFAGRVGVDDQVIAARRQLREHVRAGRDPAATRRSANCVPASHASSVFLLS